LSYALRFLRWHLLARCVAPDLSLGSSFVVGTIGFALILTPGRIGEVLKLVLLRQRTAVPVSTSAPVWIVEKISEAFALALIASVASVFLPWLSDVRHERRLELTALAVVCLIVGVAFWRPLAMAVPRLPLVSRVLRRPSARALWDNLIRGGDQVLGWRVLATSLGLSIAARICDGISIYWIGGVYGVALTLAESLFLIGSSGFLGGISMVPGGSGVAEATLIGLLLAFGADAPGATAVALTSRIFIFWIWAAIGLVLAARLAGQWGGAASEARS
jgi:uncharacterized membrane protein YbhN (UPF0104 family)